MPDRRNADGIRPVIEPATAGESPPRPPPPPPICARALTRLAWSTFYADLGLVVAVLDLLDFLRRCGVGVDLDLSAFELGLDFSFPPLGSPDDVSISVEQRALDAVRNFAGGRQDVDIH